ncbi:hypothetical protein IFM89_000852 [Coptis chinensis]|uniref:RRM domain-containing protein n=1 Tax=Coptis chinensis TaxID=261450 RepID=A0A835M6H3_9MAGN|nr:hypothetical protein IFM89_000852 [Coptis chinensis]
MSRICVKNLPKSVEEKRLRDHFSQRGEITDAKLIRTKDGKSRQFCFIGYRTEQEAEQAITYFNNSYLDTYKIVCEIARKVGDADIPRPWSRHSAKKEEAVNVGKKEEVGDKSMGKGKFKKVKENIDVSDPLLQEFLQVMQPRSQSKLWANDTVGSTLDRNDKPSAKETRLEKASSKPKVLVQEESEEKDNELTKPRSVKKSRDPALDEALNDMDYMKSRVRKDWSESESDSDSDSELGNGEDAIDESPDGEDFHEENVDEDHDEHTENPLVTRAEVADPYGNSDGGEPGNIPHASKDVKEQVLETGRLFVRNLPYTATEDDLTELFQKFGDLSEVHLVLDKGTKRSKGFAYVLYALPDSAVRALDELDNSIFQGRLLHVMPAMPKISSEKQEDMTASQTSKSFKQQREERRKASEASGNTRAWNSLFMRPDTIVENIARKHGVSKSELLDPEANDLATRVALGETQVIADTKKALENFGVNVSALEDFVSGNTAAVKRSNHVILVKNLPYSCSEGDLAEKFGGFGVLDKIVLPPTKTLALVVFLEAADARAAFSRVAYTRFKDAPLYLEWAPSNILSSNPKSKTDARNDVIVGEQDHKRILLEQRGEGIPEEDIDPDRVESRSLFVKNLNFKTSDDSLRKHFNENMKEGSVRSVKVMKHEKNGKNVSRGYGFIQFDSVETAANVCRDLQKTVLDGHALILEIGNAKKDEQVLKKVEKDKSTTKLIVRNVAFEATEKDLRDLFSPYGQIKSLKLPKKGNDHRGMEATRGFAFVDFTTKQEAQNALQALSSTHLYGRHLVLERAKEGEDLKELQARTAAQFTNEQNGFQNPMKLSKKRKNVIDESSVKFQRIVD